MTAPLSAPDSPVLLCILILPISEWSAPSDLILDSLPLYHTPLESKRPL